MKLKKQNFLAESSIRLKEEGLRQGPWLLPAIIFYGVLQGAGITCPIRFLTGVSCLGCGLTRAWISFLAMDFFSACRYHPLFLLPPFLVMIWIWRDQFSLRQMQIFFALILFLVISIYFLRLFRPEDLVVTVNITEGVLYKIYKIIWQ